MLHIRLNEQAVHRSAFHSLRMQLVFISLFSSILPAAGIAAIRGTRVLNDATTQISIAAALFASLMTLLALRRVSSYFGAPIMKWIAPVYLGSVALVLVPIFVLRAPYSTILLSLCFSFSFLSFFVLAALMVRGRRAVCYIVPVGRALDFDFEWGLRPVVLASPRMPKDPKAIFVVDLHAEIDDAWEKFLTEAALQGHPVYHYTQLREAMTGKVQFQYLSENSFGSMISAVPFTKVKRAIDIAGVVIVLPLILLPLLLVALVIKVESEGPAIFRQKRMGYRGKYFYIWKLRTMKTTEDGSNGAASVTQRNDHRITRIGAFLRRTRIDELPQMWNILRGEMSWIGPRPEAISLSAQYEAAIPYYRYRHMVRPGITGWAQVHQGHVTSVQEVDDKLQYDFYYVKNISFWLDMVIALRTVRVLASGFGAK